MDSLRSPNPPQAPLARPASFRQDFAEAARQLYEKSGAARWQLTEDEFGGALERSARHRFGQEPSRGEPSAQEVSAYLHSLHAEDLALACACSRGTEAAWEEFVAKFRPVLQAAARSIAGAAGQELADSIYADLFGLEQREVDGQMRRRSLFDYFHGRSKLSTWLRAVLAQRHVDARRASQRFESLEAGEPDDAVRLQSQISNFRSQNPGARPPVPPDPDRSRYLAALESVLSEALAALEPRDRLRLASYYADGRTLAEVGRMLGEHEATVSRKLARTIQSLRKQVERALRERQRFSPAQIRLCFEYATEEWPYDLSGALSRE
jgi:RNA polymerase sigma factor (sigma-70 family)